MSCCGDPDFVGIVVKELVEGLRGRSERKTEKRKRGRGEANSHIKDDRKRVKNFQMMDSSVSKGRHL